MPECAFHKGVETSVSCTECGRYICSKDMVPTPVGYKCRQCGIAKTTRGGVKTHQLAKATATGLLAAVSFGLMHAFIPIAGGILINALFGLIIGEAVRRGGGGHRTWEFAAIAAVVAVLGAAGGFLAGTYDVLALLIWPLAAVFSLTSIRLFD